MQEGFMAHIDTQSMYKMRRGLAQEEGVKGNNIILYYLKMGFAKIDPIPENTCKYYII